MKIDIKLTNIAQVEKAFTNGGAQMKRDIRDAFNESVLFVGRATVNEITSMNAVRTGRLRASVLGGNYGGGSFGGNVGATFAVGNDLHAEVGPTVDYAIFVHEGTKFMRGRPFLTTAVDKSISHVQDIFDSAMQGTLNKIGSSV